MTAFSFGCIFMTIFAGDQKWSKPETTGDVPAPRSAATMSAVGDKLYLFGGLSRNTGWLDDLHIYDTGVCKKC